MLLMTSREQRKECTRRIELGKSTSMSRYTYLRFRMFEFWVASAELNGPEQA